MSVSTRLITPFQKFACITNTLENIQERQPLKTLRTVKGIDKAASLPVYSKKMKMPYIDEDRLPLVAVNTSLAYWLSKFYIEQGSKEISSPGLVTAMVSMLGCLMDRKTLRAGWPRMISALGHCEINLDFVPMTMEEFYQMVLNDNSYKEFEALFDEEEIQHILTNTKTMVVLALIMLLTVSKNLHTNNYNAWFEKRVYTFAGAIGDYEVISILQSNLFPLMDSVNKCQSVFSSNKPLFSTFFEEIYSIARGKPGFIQAGMREIVEMMRGYGLQHLFIIQKYLINRHPEFLNLNCLQDLPDTYQRAMDTLDRLDPEREYFVKILYDKDECSALNRNNFHAASIVATAIAKWEDSSFENFYMENSESAVKLQELVYMTLDKRQQLLPISVGELEEWKCGPKETGAYDRIMEQHLEKVLNPPAAVTSIPQLPFQITSHLANKTTK